MRSQVANPELAEALDLVQAGLDAMREAGAEPVDADDAATILREIEGVERQVRALQVSTIDVIDRQKLHALDGHASAKVMARHVCQLSEAEAARRAQAARALRELPTLAKAFSVGRVGFCQVARLARLAANERVHDAMVSQEAMFTSFAEELPESDFAAVVREWERYADQDGRLRDAERNHSRRDALLVRLPGGGCELRARCGSLQGAELESILAAYIEAEWRADWAQARATFGDAATTSDLARTDAQRRFDALRQIFLDGASAHANTPGGSVIVTNVVIDQATWEAQLKGLSGEPLPPVDPTIGGVPAPWGGRLPPTDGLDPGSREDRQVPEAGGPPVGCDPPGGLDRPSERHPPGGVDPPGGFDRFRCSTIDGDPIDPTEATVVSLLGHVRRVVVGSRSVVTDLGRRQRLFTGAAQLAVRIASNECFWIGCHVPASRCQSDHVVRWVDGGPTAPTNGVPACGRHNRLKESGGYRVHRDDDGRFHIFRPDGTEIS